MSGLTIEEVYKFWRGWFAARVRQDGEALQGMMSKDYISTHSDGIRRTREEYIELFTGGGKVVIDLQDTRIRIYGNTAVITDTVLLAGIDQSEETTTEKCLYVTGICVKEGEDLRAVALHISGG